jgi:hypothetical protein
MRSCFILQFCIFSRYNCLLHLGRGFPSGVSSTSVLWDQTSRRLSRIGQSSSTCDLYSSFVLLRLYVCSVLHRGNRSFIQSPWESCCSLWAGMPLPLIQVAKCLAFWYAFCSMALSGTWKNRVLYKHFLPLLHCCSCQWCETMSLNCGYSGSIVHPPGDMWAWRAMLKWYWQGKTEELGEDPVPLLFSPPQIPHGLTRARSRPSAVRGLRLTAWAMARPWLYDRSQRVFDDSSTELIPRIDLH